MQKIGIGLLKGGKFKAALVTISNRCNSFCSKCYQDAGPDGRIRTLDESLGIVDSLQKQGFVVIPEMMELLPETVHLLEVYQRAGSKQISTNGELLVDDPNIFDSLRKYGIDEIRITLDHPNVHEAWTHRKRERAIEAIEKSVEKGFRVVLNYTVSRSTIPYLDEACEEGEKLGMHQVNFLNYIFYNRACSMPEEVLGARDIQEFHGKYLELRKKYKEKGIVLDRTGNFGPNPDPKSLSGKLAQQGMACWAGKSKFGEEYFIDINNNIYPCMTLRTQYMIIGKLVNGELKIEKDVTKDWHRKTCYSLHHQLENSILLY